MESLSYSAGERGRRKNHSLYSVELDWICVQLFPCVYVKGNKVCIMFNAHAQSIIALIAQVAYFLVHAV